MAGLIDRLHWLGHASFVIRDGKVIYFDPYKIEEDVENADLVLVTHEHFDHCSPDDIHKVIQPGTVIVTVAGNEEKLSGIAGQIADVKYMAPGDRVTVDEITIEAVPAYNTNKKFHPRDNSWVGFIVEIDGEKIYHAGDTDLIPEMSSVECDIALLPVSGTYVMTAGEAVMAAKEIGPKIAIPMHYGDVVGDEEDAREFETVCECEVRVLGKE